MPPPLLRPTLRTALLLGAMAFLLPSCRVPDVTDLWEPQASRPPRLSPVDFAQTPTEPPNTRDASSAPEDPGDDQPLVTGIREASLLALQHNPSFRIKRMQPAIDHTYEQQERAVFDPTLSADVSASRTRDRTEANTAGANADNKTRESTRDGGVALTVPLPTGTTLGLSGRRSRGEMDDDSDRKGVFRNDSRADTYDLTVTQALLRGFGPQVNLARLRQAKLDTRISRFVLKAAAEALVYQTEATGWDYLLAQRQIQIYEESLRLAEDQLAEVRERIKVGALADIELAAVQAEVAQRKEDLINARSMLAKTRLEFFRLLGQGGPKRWRRGLTLTDTPSVPAGPLAPLEQHVAVALKQRPDLAEARLRIDRGELDVTRTRNGLLPRLDFFITLGGSRYAHSFGEINKDSDGRTREMAAGVQMEYVLGHRAERAAYDRSRLSLQQQKEALRNQKDLAQVDVRTAYLEVERTAEQINATQATRKHRAEALRSETEKFRVGKSTSILVAQAQRDLVVSRIAEVEAVVQNLKARLNLYRQEGSLLQRRGISLDTR